MLIMGVQIKENIMSYLSHYTSSLAFSFSLTRSPPLSIICISHAHKQTHCPLCPVLCVSSNGSGSIGFVVNDTTGGPP